MIFILSGSLNVKGSTTGQPISSLPRGFRGQWYTKKHKMNVTKRRMDGSKYTNSKKKLSKLAVANCVELFMPYSINKSTLLLRNGQSGKQLIRCLYIHGEKILIQYEMESNYFRLRVFTRSKKSKEQKVMWNSNPLGGPIFNKKRARQQAKAYKKMNPIIKKYMGSYLQLKRISGFGVSIDYYD